MQIYSSKRRLPVLIDGRRPAVHPAFIARRDSFYMATTNSDGWPYLQHRGGPAGFLRVLGPHQLGFADFKGNRQMLTTGNLDGNDRVALFLVDYPTALAAMRRNRVNVLSTDAARA